MAEVTPAVTSVAVGTVSESQSVAWMWFPLSSIEKAAVCLPWADSAIRLVTLFPDTPRSALVSESTQNTVPTQLLTQDLPLHVTPFLHS